MTEQLPQIVILTGILITAIGFYALWRIGEDGPSPQDPPE